MADIEVQYKGSTIKQQTGSGTVTLHTEGKYMEDDVDIVYTAPGGDSAELLSILARTKSGAITNSDITALGAYGMSYMANATKISLPNCASLGDHAFYYNRNVTEYNLPNVETITADWYHFAENRALVGLILPKLKGTHIWPSICYNNKLMVYADFGAKASGKPGQVGGSAFYGATAFNTLILRYTQGALTLSNINAFSGTCFASGGSGGTLYVPSALVATYTQSSNWSTIIGYANNQIKAIENSIYDGYYADGTAIPA